MLKISFITNFINRQMTKISEYHIYICQMIMKFIYGIQLHESIILKVTFSST
jgi:hypothetical protein